MCRPDYFDVVYEINPWMIVRRKVERDKALRQWTDLYGFLTEELKLRVELLDPVEGLPDLVFTANGGIVRKRVFVRSNFRHKERKGEERYFEDWFKKAGYIVKTIDRPFCFEGEGDALFLGEELYAGYVIRSDVEAHDAVADTLGLSCSSLMLCDHRFYHLDTCFTPLDGGSALVFLPAFEPYARQVLSESVPDLIRVPEEEALSFACNAIVSGEDVVMPLGCPKTSRVLKDRGFRVHDLDFSEFIKAGGAAKCLVLRIE